MLSPQLTESVLALPEDERLELARQIVASVTDLSAPTDEFVRQGVGRLEDVIVGKVKGLTEEEYRRAVG